MLIRWPKILLGFDRLFKRRRSVSPPFFLWPLVFGFVFHLWRFGGFGALILTSYFLPAIFLTLFFIVQFEFFRWRRWASALAVFPLIFSPPILYRSPILSLFLLFLFVYSGFAPFSAGDGRRFGLFLLLNLAFWVFLWYN